MKLPALKTESVFLYRSSMKKILIFFFIVLMPLTAFAQQENEAIYECMKAMSSVRSLLEFYYMNTGSYPASLEIMDRVFNDDIKKSTDRVVIPNEPQTGKPFSYTPSKDLKSYTLYVADPERYGLKEMKMSSLSWGWMNSIAKNIDLTAKSDLCRRYMQAIFNASKMYKKRYGVFPSNISKLVPEFLKQVPLCPVSGKPYSVVSSENFTVLCPTPEAHRHKIFRYTQKKGFELVPISEKTPNRKN